MLNGSFYGCKAYGVVTPGPVLQSSLEFVSRTHEGPKHHRSGSRCPASSTPRTHRPHVMALN